MSEKNLRLESGKTLHELLSKVVNESVKSALYQRSLQEKEKQDAQSSNAAPEKAPDVVPDEPVASATANDDNENLKQGDIEADDVIEKLNSIRSGRSFRDQTVKSNMEQYVDSLSTAEKTALLAFLKGISQIVTGEIPAPQAEDPSDDPSSVEMKKGPEGQKTKHIEPNVIKGTRPQKKKDSIEDTTEPAPIVPRRK